MNAIVFPRIKQHQFKPMSPVTKLYLKMTVMVAFILVIDTVVFFVESARVRDFDSMVRITWVTAVLVIGLIAFRTFLASFKESWTRDQS